VLGDDFWRVRGMMGLDGWERGFSKGGLLHDGSENVVDVDWIRDHEVVSSRGGKGETSAVTV